MRWAKLNHPAKADMLFRKLIKYAEQNKDNQVSLDYFAVSLPDLLIF